MGVTEPLIPEHVEKVARMVAEAVRAVLGPEARIIWYGSWVRGQAAARSDLDIAYEAAGPVSIADRIRLSEEVGDLPTLYDVDLVDLHRAGAALRDEILRHGVPL